MALIGDIEKYRPNEEYIRAIIDGIITGNKDYADFRLRENPNLLVSQGLSWARSNFIDTGIAHNIEENNVKGMSFEKAHSGYAWQYLQFVLNDNRKAMIVVRPAKIISTFFNQDQLETDKFKNNNNLRLSSINQNNFTADDPTAVVGQIQFDLDYADYTQLILGEFEPFAKEKGYKDFYILGYTLNEQREVKNASLFMPDPFTQQIQEIQDLKDYVAASESRILNEKQREAIASDAQIPASQEYDVKIDEAEWKKN